MIHVIARIQATPGKRSELLEAFHELLPEVHAEAGCVAYAPAVDVDADIERFEPANDAVVTIVERWESVAHLRAHLAASHMDRFREEHGHLVAGAELRLFEDA